MLKPASLRGVLERFVPALAADPAKLSLFIDKGQVAALAGSLSFEDRYTLNIVVQDYAGDADALIVPLLAWIARDQPELLRRSDEIPFRFESELLGEGVSDVSIYLDLTERVGVEVRDGGGFRTTHPDAVDDDAPEFDDFGIGCVPLWAVLLGSDVAAATTDPRFAG